MQFGRSFKSQGILFEQRQELMYPNNFTFVIDMELPDFDLPPVLEALPTAELRLLTLLHMGDKGILPSLAAQFALGDRVKPINKLTKE